MPQKVHNLLLYLDAITPADLRKLDEQVFSQLLELAGVEPETGHYPQTAEAQQSPRFHPRSHFKLAVLDTDGWQRKIMAVFNWEGRLLRFSMQKEMT